MRPLTKIVRLLLTGRDRRKRMRAESTGHFLAQEFSRFSCNSLKLRRLFNDTKRAIGEVIRGGYFNGGEFNQLFFLLAFSKDGIVGLESISKHRRELPGFEVV